ncbi:MAG: GxxExxY protein [Bellilinea sp.]
MLYNESLTKNIIGAAIEVHKTLGPALLESAYQACLARELSLMNIPFEQELNLPVEYKGVKVDCGYRIDFVVDKSTVVELKAVAEILPVHKAQLLTYLKLTGIKTGLLINFNVPILTRGITRMVN